MDMLTCFIPRAWCRHAVLFGLTLLVAQALIFRYLAEENVENVDMGYLSGRTLIIDAGHGGIDSGARYNSLLEKDINLSISLKLGELLKEQGANVLYTRDEDLDYYTKGKGGKRKDLMTRVEMINASQADLFISIHCNAVSGAQWYGSQVFFNPSFPENKQLAAMMQLLLKKFPPNNKRLEKEDKKILILNMAQIPGVLLEAGYLSNRKEAEMLADHSYQEKMVQQIAKALACYFKEKESINN